jgi:uncharacterized membrane protein
VKTTFSKVWLIVFTLLVVAGCYLIMRFVITVQKWYINKENTDEFVKKNYIKKETPQSGAYLILFIIVFT